MLVRSATGEFTWEDNLDGHNFCSIPKCRGLSGRQLLSCIWEHMFSLASLNKLLRIHLFEWAFALQNKFQREYYLWSHQHAYWLRKQHACLFLFLIQFLFGMIVGMNVLHRTSKAYFRIHHSKLFQNKRILMCDQVACPLLEKYSLSSLHA